MDEPYIGEIRPISFTYAPKGWAFCNGQSLPINQNQALYSLLGVQFGGNGTTTFNLPDLRSRVPVGTGQLAGGSSYAQGTGGGTESVTLTQNQMPTHMHPFTGSLQTSDSAEQVSPANNLPAAGGFSQYVSGPSNTIMGNIISGSTTNAGSGQGHENRQPYTALNYVIALVGIYPSRQ